MSNDNKEQEQARLPATGAGLVPPGVTVNSTINPAALPGFDFNTTGPLGTNPVVGPGIVGFQGLSSQRQYVGRNSSTRRRMTMAMATPRANAQSVRY